MCGDYVLQGYIALCRCNRQHQGPGFDLGAAKELAVPWIVLQGEIDQVKELADYQAGVDASFAEKVGG